MAIEKGVKLRVEILPDAGKMNDGLRTLKDALAKDHEQIRSIGAEWDKIFRDPKQPTIKALKRDEIEGGGEPAGSKPKGNDPLSEFARGVGGPLAKIGAIYDKLRGGIEGLGRVFAGAEKPSSTGSTGGGFFSGPAPRPQPAPVQGGSSGFTAPTKGPDLSKIGGQGKTPSVDIKSVGGEAAEAGEAGAAGEGIMAALGPIGMIAGAAVLAGTALKGLADAGFSAAAKANPAVVNRFQLAMDDMTAVIGQRFLPVVEFSTGIVRSFGDFLANALPSVGDVSSALEDLRPAMDEIKDAFADFAPLLKQIARQWLTDFAAGLKVAMLTVKQFVQSLRDFFGVEGDRKKNDQSSMGASAQQARVGGIDDIGKSILEAALGQGNMGKQDPQEKLENTLSKLIKSLEEMGGPIGDIAKWLREHGDAIGKEGAKDVVAPAIPLWQLLIMIKKGFRG